MILFRYLCKEIYSSIIGITVVLLVIFVTDQFMHYLRDAASGQITMTAVMQIMSLQIPLLLGYLLPLALYLSILIGYGRLYADNEMTIMSSSGFSRAQLMQMTLTMALFVTLIVGVLMLWLVPIIEDYRTKIVDKAVSAASIKKIVPKRFQGMHDGSVIYVDSLDRDSKTMREVFMARLPNDHNPTWDVMWSKQAREKTIKGLDGNFIVFDEGRRYQGTPGEKNIREISFKQYGVQLTAAHVHISDWPNDVPTGALLTLIKSEKDVSKRHRLQAMWQWRLAMPISVLLFTLLAIPLSEINPRAGKFARILPAILIYIAYADLMFLGRAWIERGAISPSLGLWWIHGAALFLAVLLNIHCVGWQRFFKLTCRFS